MYIFASQKLEWKFSFKWTLFHIEYFVTFSILIINTPLYFLNFSLHRGKKICMAIYQYD